MHDDSEPVIVEEYNPEWALWFETLCSLLKPILGEYVIRIEHVGSTAVPGMLAKPIIDLNIVIRDEDFEEVNSILSEIGFVHLGDLGITGREAFNCVDPELKSRLPPHHLYICDLHAEELNRQVTFRNYLRTHPDDANAYSEFKRHLVREYSGNRVSYIEGKDALVKEILERALRWASGH
ncbi:MAG: GrpB family protein [Promethearchaeota archaeon]